MKKNHLTVVTCLLAAAAWSCNDNNTHGRETDSTATVTPMGTDTSATGRASTTPSTTPMNTTPLSKDDSTFVMEAAVGGMLEVEAGKLAQQNADNQRIKDFGAMMVRDHSQASNELKNLVANRGVMLPDSLPADKRKHLESMQKMKGKTFDSHYISMMKDDHSKDISKFEKEGKDGKDMDIKNWASQTLPTLKKHKDSIDAIAKAKM